MTWRPLPFCFESTESSISKRLGSIRRDRTGGVRGGWLCWFVLRFSVLCVSTTNVTCRSGRVWDCGLGHWGDEQVGLVGEERGKDRPRKGERSPGVRINCQRRSPVRLISEQVRGFKGVYFSLDLMRTRHARWTCSRLSKLTSRRWSQSPRP